MSTQKTVELRHMKDLSLALIIIIQTSPIQTLRCDNIKSNRADSEPSILKSEPHVLHDKPYNSATAAEMMVLSVLRL